MKYYLGTRDITKDYSEDSIIELFQKVYDSGVRNFECATNYPLAGDMKFFRRTEEIMLHWTSQQNITDIEILMNAGAIDNKENPEYNDCFSYHIMCSDDYIDRFKELIAIYSFQTEEKISEESVDRLVDVAKVISSRVDVAFAKVDYSVFADTVAKYSLIPYWILDAEKAGVQPEAEGRVILDFNNQPDIESFSGQLAASRVEGVIIQATSYEEFEKVKQSIEATLK